MHSLTNVPTLDSGKLIKAFVTGTTGNIDIRCVEKVTEGPRDGVSMTSLYIGEHMFLPENHSHLRQLIGDAVATAIRMGRDAGYKQAQAAVRRAMGAASKDYER